jgi:hypothetical protein
MAEEDIALRKQVSSQVTLDLLVRVIPILWDLKSRIQGVLGGDQLALMSMAWVMLCQIFSPVQAQEPKAPPVPSKALTLEEMEERIRQRQLRR